MVAIIVVVIVILIKSAAGITNDFSPLHMDVEWILQGKNFGFSGFFVEFLGISRAIRTFLPHLRLAQSFFYEYLDESPLPFRSSAVCTEMIIDSSVGLDRQGDDAISKYRYLLKDKLNLTFFVTKNVKLNHLYSKTFFQKKERILSGLLTQKTCCTVRMNCSRIVFLAPSFCRT